jgi:hypothetical protein
MLRIIVEGSHTKLKPRFQVYELNMSEVMKQGSDWERIQESIWHKQFMDSVLAHSDYIAGVNSLE